MKLLFFSFIIFLFIQFGFASQNDYLFYHDTPHGVVRGDEVKFEVLLTGTSNKIYDMKVFYRQPGEFDFHSIDMRRDGYLYSASLKTSSFLSGQIEYYIGYEGALGEIGTLPNETPQFNPFIMRIAPASDDEQPATIEIVILSPDVGDMVEDEDFIIAASFVGDDSKIDYMNSKLLIDGLDVSRQAEFSDGLVTLTPPKMRQGFHNIELSIIDTDGNELGKKEWSFRVQGSSGAVSGSFFRGSAFLENRFQSIGKIDPAGSGEFSDEENFFRTGGEFSGGYNKLLYRGRLVISSEEEEDRQPVNRYSGEVRYLFSPDDEIFLRGGDFNPYYNPLIIKDKRVRGLQAGIAYGFFTFDFIYGQLYRGVNGIQLTTIDSTSFADSTIVFTSNSGGTYANNILAFQPGFRFGEHVAWKLNLVNTKEDKNSIQYGGDVNESLAMGTDLNLNFDKKRILFDASVEASIKNSNAGAEEITYEELDSLSGPFDSSVESLFNILKDSGFLTITPGLNPLPSIAMQFETTLRYFKNNLNIQYFNIAKNFASPANPYLLKDISGFTIRDYFRILDNRVFMNVFYKNSINNKSENDLATTSSEFGANISYFPMTNIPTFTIGYSNINRANDINPDSLLAEDNNTQSITFSTSYNIDIKNIRNTISLNITNYVRDENISKENQSDFTLFGVSLRNRFEFPLTTRLNYSQTESVFGDTSQSTTNIKRYFVGLEYLVNNLLGNDIFKPFINVTIQELDITSTGSTTSTTRNNYTAGLTYRNSSFGLFSIRYDHISYSTLDLNDTVINARYEITF